MENQYLKPEELPITDAKKSPLALLAMTCSNIGADILGTGKPMLSLEKSKNKTGSEDSRSESVTSDKIQANSIDSNRSNSLDGSSDGEARHGSSNASSSNHKISFKPYEDLPKSHFENNNNNNNGHYHHHTQDRRLRSCINSSQRREPSPSPKRKEPEQASSPSSSSCIFRKAASASKSPDKNSTSSSSSSSLAHTSPLSSSTSSSLLNSDNQTDKLLLGYHHPSKSVGVCRDVFCTGCHLSHLPSSSSPFLAPTSSSLSSCCSSFPHCVHAMAHFASSFPHPSLAYASSLSGRYGISNGSLIPSNRPFLCHWTAGGSYCGKAFTSCEDLLQHLKSHTLSSSAVNSASSSSSSLTSSSPSASSFPALGSFMSPHVSSSLMSGLSVRPGSNLDPLRYHPYKVNGVPSSLGGQLRSPTSLAGSNLFSHHHHQHHSSLASPSVTVFPPSQHPSLGSYYTLLN